jgi:hypothetical protein
MAIKLKETITKEGMTKIRRRAVELKDEDHQEGAKELNEEFH